LKLQNQINAINGRDNIKRRSGNIEHIQFQGKTKNKVKKRKIRKLDKFGLLRRRKEKES